MKPSEGLELPHPDMVCKLNKSLYGLKQASRQWHSKLTKALLSENFKQSIAKPSLFTKKVNGKLITLLVYVDDVLLASNNISLIYDTKKYLDQTFKIKDLGPAKYFLGFELA